MAARTLPLGRGEVLTRSIRKGVSGRREEGVLPRTRQSPPPCCRTRTWSGTPPAGLRWTLQGGNLAAVDFTRRESSRLPADRKWPLSLIATGISRSACVVKTAPPLTPGPERGGGEWTAESRRFYGDLGDQDRCLDLGNAQRHRIRSNRIMTRRAFAPSIFSN